MSNFFLKMKNSGFRTDDLPFGSPKSFLNFTESPKRRLLFPSRDQGAVSELIVDLKAENLFLLGVEFFLGDHTVIQKLFELLQFIRIALLDLLIIVEGDF